MLLKEKKYKKLRLLFSVITVLTFYSLVAQANSKQLDYQSNTIGQMTQYYPEIKFSYDWRSCIMDTIAGFYYGNVVTDEMQKQLEKQLPILIAAWRKDAQIFFGIVFSFFKRGFKDKERTAIVNLSHGYSYGSHWLLVLGLRRFLNSDQWNPRLNKEDAFSSLVFHELLHIWVDENLNEKKSLILLKYCNEDSHILAHLHLMAIQKMVYLKINRPDLLEMLDDSYCNFSPPAFRRAWEIVNDVEGYENVLSDLLNNMI